MMVLIDDWIVDDSNLINYFYFNIFYNNDGYYDMEDYL